MNTGVFLYSMWSWQRLYKRFKYEKDIKRYNKTYFDAQMAKRELYINFDNKQLCPPQIIFMVIFWFKVLISIKKDVRYYSLGKIMPVCCIKIKYNPFITVKQKTHHDRWLIINLLTFRFNLLKWLLKRD